MTDKDVHDRYPAIPGAGRRGSFNGEMMSAELCAWLRAQRQARGWNVPEMARQLRRAARASGDTVPDNTALCTYIRRWERGLVGPSERYMLHYCKAFGVPPAEYGHSADRRQVARAAEQPAGEIATEPYYSEIVRRNEFLALSGAALASLLAPPLVHGWPDRHVAAVPELTEQLLTQLRAQNEGFRWLDRKSGAYDLIQPTTVHARNLTALWRLTEPAHPLRSALAQVAADACHLVAYQAFDQARRVQAIEWYRCSAELAAQGGARDLYVFAVCGVAYMHALNRDGQMAMSVLQQLTPLAQTPAAQCYVAVYQAHAFASLRGYDDALLALDRAAAHTSQARNDAPSAWLGIPDAAFVCRQRARIAADLGSPEALGLLSMLDKQTPDVFQRYRVTLLTDQALAYARLGEAEQSARLLAEAARRNQRVRSAQKASLIQGVRTALTRTQSGDAVRALDEALRSDDAAPPSADGP
jgi:transcriptional regulator with XRE-family HTH domain